MKESDQKSSSKRIPNPKGYNGQPQLWIFFLELLSDKRYECIIRWLKADGTFEIVDPEELAILWGQRKFNKTMNYSKLSRSLRTYNKNKNKICKVNGMKRVYKFTCDLKQYFGYDAQQLFNMAN